MCGIAFVEEGAAQQLDIAELSGWEFLDMDGLNGIVKRHLHLARHVDIEAGLLLFLLVVSIGHRNGAEISHSYILRFAREVIFVHNA